jgi:hypothetical protein
MRPVAPDSPPKERPFHWLIASALALLPLMLSAQIAVTSITTSTTDTWNNTVNGTTFERTTVSITQFLDAAGNIYDTNTVAGSAYVRRNTSVGNSNNSSVWYDQGATSTQFSGTHANTYSSLLLGNNLLRGSDNTFANGTVGNQGNIERLDFLFSASGFAATTSTSFAVFDRGEIGVHDYVKIAVITGWNNSTNMPTNYGGNLVSIDSADYGTTNIATSFTYSLFRYNNGDNLSTWTSNSETGTQGIGGTIISMADLGIAPGTIIYGYSLMAYDVTDSGNVSNLVNWNNTTYYPSNTTDVTGTGGIDLSAVNGVLYNRRVPEPSTYGAILLGASMIFFAWRRSRAQRLPVAR